MTGERQGGTNVPKYFVAKRILERGIVKVHLNPRLDGVHVPSHYKEDPVLLLQFAYGFQLPSFQVDEEAISGVLNFNGLRFHCVVPWEAVFALTAPEFGHEGQFWPEDVPRELLEEIEAAADLMQRLLCVPDRYLHTTYRLMEQVPNLPYLSLPRPVWCL